MLPRKACCVNWRVNNKTLLLSRFLNINQRMNKKIFNYFKVWGNDYTVLIYILRISGYILTSLYFAGTFFNKKKAKQFNQKNNFFHILRKNKIQEFNNSQDKEFNEKFLMGDRYDFNGVFLPKIKNTYLLRTVYDDVLKIYTEKDDNYDYKIVDEIDKIIPEGVYCYIEPNGEDITIKRGDIVIDAGAWIGDFSAYASKKGAHVYAFEPSPSNLNILKKTVEYNKGNGGDITIVPLWTL